MPYLMGVDLGTSSLKVLLIDADGTVKAQSARAYCFDSPFPGYAEQNPEDWWQACCECTKETIAKSGLPASEIKSIGFSGQMHGLVLLDRDNRAIRPAILHCDSRSDRQVAWLREAFHDQLSELFSNPPYTGFLLPSLLWVRDNEPENFAKARTVCLPKDYLRFKLTGEVSSDYSDASATLAFDIQAAKWSEKILGLAHLPPDLFPPCHDTAAAVGTVSQTAARETGLAPGTLVVCGGGDQVMQGIGNGAVGIGTATVNIGTSGQVCFQSDSPVLNPELNTNLFCGYEKGRWIAMGATMSAGLSLRRFKELFDQYSFKEIDEKVKGLQPGSGGLLYLPYLNGERTPHLNPNLSGLLLGLNLTTDVFSIARAVMEGVSYSLMQCLEIFGALGLSPKMLIASGGGARSAPWLQIQADVYGLPLKVAKTEEQAGFGAAIAAGAGAGIFRDIGEGCRAIVKYTDQITVPDETNHRIYKEYYSLYKETYTACKNVLEKTTEIGRRH